MDKTEHRTSTGMSRRAFLGGATAAVPLLYAAPGGLLARALAQASNAPDGAVRPAHSQFPSPLIIRTREPENFEFPFSSLDSFITPTERFYVRSHFAQPKIEARDWRLHVEGAVDHPFELNYDELQKMPSRTVVATLECAGNNRVFLNPAERGVQWELGAVGTAEWTGVPLSAILARAGLRPGSLEAVLQGADSGEIRDEPKSPGKINFARSLPLSKALQPDVLLAYRMNGAELTPSHGFPVRAVVPGWYGVASVKWLNRILVTAGTYAGYYETFDYTYWQRRNGLPIVTPITEMEVKAQIARPAMLEVVPMNTIYRVHGAAWTGESEVTKVEVTFDEGKTWAQAQLLGSPGRYTWRLWEYNWPTTVKAGRYTVMARATDARGRVQPMQRDADRRNYMISHVLPISVEVR